jgi:hypothetical protein
LRWPRDTLYPQKLALTSPTSGGCSVGIVRLRTTGHGVFYFFIYSGSRLGKFSYNINDYSRLSKEVCLLPKRSGANYWKLICWIASPYWTRLLSWPNVSVVLDYLFNILSAAFRISRSPTLCTSGRTMSWWKRTNLTRSFRTQRFFSYTLSRVHVTFMILLQYDIIASARKSVYRAVT